MQSGKGSPEPGMSTSCKHPEKSVVFFSTLRFFSQVTSERTAQAVRKLKHYIGIYYDDRKGIDCVRELGKYLNSWSMMLDSFQDQY